MGQFQLAGLYAAVTIADLNLIYFEATAGNPCSWYTCEEKCL